MAFPFFTLLILFFFGTALGSFLNVAAARSLSGESFLFGRSRCPYCKQELCWFDLIPVFSFLFLQGRCRRCHTSLSIRYLFVELGVGFLVVLLYHAVFSGVVPTPFLALISRYELFFFVYLVVVSAAVVVFLTDLEAQLIPTGLTRILALVGIICLLLEGVVSHAGKASLAVFLLASLVALFFAAIWFFTHGRGMGRGDFELAFFLSLFLSFPYALLMVLLAFWIGAVVGIGLLLTRRYSFQSRIAFGPFLILGFFLVLLWGRALFPLLFPLF